MYISRSNPDLGIEKIAIRKIPYVCNSCLEQLDSVLKTETIDEQKRRYKTSNKCKMNTIFTV